MLGKEVLAIDARSLCRDFYPHRGILRKGPAVRAVDDLNLQVTAGTIFGLLGPNGAGKTTTIKILASLLLPTSGVATVAGFDVVRHEREVRQRLGVLLGGDRGLYGKISAADNLRYFATLYGVNRGDIETRVQAFLSMVGLDHRQKERVENFSRGMKQRLHLAKALIHEPEIIFLDEPTIGLDPEAAVQLRAIVRDLVPKHTVLLTTHYLAEADDLCDRIAIIDQGRIIAEDTPTGIKHMVGSSNLLQIEVRGAIDEQVIEFLRLSSSIDRLECMYDNAVDVTTIEVRTISPEHVTGCILKTLIADSYAVREVRTREISLEEAFLSLTRDPEPVGVSR